ncbi:MAG: hypothetical protein N3B18_05330 [Desulfobacterota bacterium]|nr:hypothetical protein [Thermodesulfobacteriota bacterium]
MKTITIKISDADDANRALACFHTSVPAQVKTLPEFAAVQSQIVVCIEDFAGKVKKIAKSGTTIHIRKEFFLPRMRLVIVLDYPRKPGFLEKLREAVRGKTSVSKLTA